VLVLILVFQLQRKLNLAASTPQSVKKVDALEEET